MTRVSALVLLVVCSVLVTGCTGVPTSGPVERVSAAPGRFNPGVEIAPAPPGRNAAPTIVVEGFLHAMASNQPSYAVARSYLTPAAAAAWDPAAGVRIYGEGSPVVPTDGGAVLRAPVVGSLDAEGAYRQSTETIDHDFGLIQDREGQWRISTPPTGLLISEYLFTSAFQRVTPHFFAQEGRWLVPDPRFFPRGSSAYESAARAVLTGPTRWLGPAVEPPSLPLRLERVSVTTTGLATITLNRPEVEPTPEQQEALAAQLVWTFRSLESVSSVTIEWADGEPWQVEPYGSAIPIAGFPDADPTARQSSRQPFALSGGGVVRLLEGPDTTEHLPVAPGIVDASAAAVRLDSLAVAAVSGDRTMVVIAPLGEPVVTEVGRSSGLRRPQFDRHGAVWVTDESGGLAMVPPDGLLTAVAFEQAGEGHIEAFRVSPDGTRIAIVLQRPGGHQVLGLARIERRAGGVLVTGWREVQVATTAVAQLSVLDVGWRTADSLLVLTSDGRSASVQAITMDGSTIAPIGPTEATELVELAVAPGAPALVRSADGQVWRYNSDLRWSQHDTSLSSVFYP